MVACVSTTPYLRHGILVAFRAQGPLPQVDLMSFRVELSLAREASCKDLDCKAPERAAKSREVVLRPVGADLTLKTKDFHSESLVHKKRCLLGHNLSTVLTEDTAKSP